MYQLYALLVTYRYAQALQYVLFVTYRNAQAIFTVCNVMLCTSSKSRWLQTIMNKLCVLFVMYRYASTLPLHQECKLFVFVCL
jgi:hypothetical protein